MILRITALREIVGETEDRPGVRFRYDVSDLKPGQRRLRATLENGSDTTDAAFDVWLDELPDGTGIGSEFDIEFKPRRNRQ